MSFSLLHQQRVKMFKALLLCLGFSVSVGTGLVGCDKNSSQSVTFPDTSTPTIIFASPFDAQQGVGADATITIKFSEPLQAGADGEWPGFLVFDEIGNPVPGQVRVADDEGLVLVFTPDLPLKPGVQYEVRLENMQSKTGRSLTQENSLRFSTAPMVEGFAIVQLFPDLPLPVMDFTSFRLQLSEQVNADTVKYGDTVALYQGEQLVPARLEIQDRYITIDPIDDLQPELAVRLHVTDKILSVSGETLKTPIDETLVVGDSNPRSVLALQIEKPAGGSDLSTLTGQPVNTIALSSTLLGESLVTQSGQLVSELAYASNYPDNTPIVIRRGNVITSPGMELLIDGQVHTAQSTGELKITLINDAVGYMIVNPFTTDPFAPRNVMLYLDVVMTSSNPVINSALNQKLMHMVASGTVLVQGGLLTLDVTSQISVDLLGLDTASGLVTFHLKSFEDASIVPPLSEDYTAPKYTASFPEADGILMDRAATWKAIFSEPLDPASVAEQVELVGADDEVVPSKVRVDGATIYLAPLELLAFGQTYRMRINSVADLTGNVMAEPVEVAVDVVSATLDPQVGPRIVMSYPGYSCALQADTFAIADGIAGRCAGGLATDDLLPIVTMPNNRDIRISFSQPMAEASLVMAESCSSPGTVRVEKIDAVGACTSIVSGSLDLSADRQLRFTPDQPWETAGLYRFILQSSSQTGECGIDAICNRGGVPLDTDVLDFDTDQVVWQTLPSGNSFFTIIPGDRLEDAIGGIDYVMPFQGAAATSDILTLSPLRPLTDINGNGQVDEGETPRPFNRATPTIGEVPALIESNGKPNIVNAEGNSIGCGPTDDAECSNDKLSHIYLTGALSAEIARYDEAQGGVVVTLRPQMLYGTEIKLNTEILGAQQQRLSISSGPMVMRIRYGEEGTLPTALIKAGGIDEAGNIKEPMMEASLNLYMDAPQLTLLGGLAQSDLVSREITLNASGPLTFMPDGRMQFHLENTDAISVDVNISAYLGSPEPLLGRLPLIIGAGALKISGVIDVPF